MKKIGQLAALAMVSTVVLMPSASLAAHAYVQQATGKSSAIPVQSSRSPAYVMQAPPGARYRIGGQARHATSPAPVRKTFIAADVAGRPDGTPAISAPPKPAIAPYPRGPLPVRPFVTQPVSILLTGSDIAALPSVGAGTVTN